MPIPIQMHKQLPYPEWNATVAVVVHAYDQAAEYGPEVHSALKRFVTSDKSGRAATLMAGLRTGLLRDDSDN